MKEIGKMIKNMEKENMFIIVQMNIMMAIGEKEKDMVKEKQDMHMVIYIMEILKKMKEMVLVLWNLQMEQELKEIGLMDNYVDKQKCNIQMEIYMMVNGQIIKKMVMENIQCVTDNQFIQDNLEMI